MADEKVVSLRGAVLPNVPVPNVVDHLRKLLARAEQGDVRAVAFAIVRRDGTVGFTWAKPETGTEVAMDMETLGLGFGILSLSVEFGRMDGAPPFEA